LSLFQKLNSKSDIDKWFRTLLENEEMHLIEFIPKEKRKELRLLGFAIGISIIGILVPDWYLRLGVVIVLIILFLIGLNSKR